MFPFYSGFLFEIQAIMPEKLYYIFSYFINKKIKKIFKKYLQKHLIYVIIISSKERNSSPGQQGQKGQNNEEKNRKAFNVGACKKNLPERAWNAQGIWENRETLS